MYQISLRTDKAAAQDLSDILLSETGDITASAVSAFESEDASHWLVEALFDVPPDRAQLRTLLGNHLSQQDWATLDIAQLPEVDWVVRSQQALAPVRAGRFTVHGSHDRDRVHGALNAVEIDAGQAFGTAHHGTTRGCLIMLDRVLQNEPARFNMLDLGCGTGVLAIAVAKMFRRPVWASDCDTVSVAVAAENARINGVGHLLRPVTAAGFAHPKLREAAPYNLMVANILAGPLYDLAPDIRVYLASGGKLILSGVLHAQASRLRARYAAQGFRMVSQKVLEGWATMLLQRTA